MELKIDNATLETMVRNELALGVAKVLSAKSDVLIRTLVEQALSAKKDNWNKKTLVDELVEKMILEEAKNAIREWVDDNRAVIKERVRAKLNAKHELVEKVAEAMTAQMDMTPVVSVWFKPDE